MSDDTLIGIKTKRRNLKKKIEEEVLTSRKRLKTQLGPFWTQDPNFPITEAYVDNAPAEVILGVAAMSGTLIKSEEDRLKIKAAHDEIALNFENHKRNTAAQLKSTFNGWQQAKPQLPSAAVATPAVAGPRHVSQHLMYVPMKQQSIFAGTGVSVPNHSTYTEVNTGNRSYGMPSLSSIPTSIPAPRLQGGGGGGQVPSNTGQGGGGLSFSKMVSDAEPYQPPQTPSSGASSTSEVK